MGNGTSVALTDLTDSHMVEFVPDSASNANMDLQESQEAPLISHQMLPGSVYWGRGLKSAALG